MYINIIDLVFHHTITRFFRFDVYKCLVECYVHMNRLREAEATASNACKQLNQSAQALTV